MHSGKNVDELSACARCAARLGRSCCEVSQAEHLATLTRADVERVSGETGLAARQFVEHEPLGEEESRAYERRRPAWTGYFRNAPVRWTLGRRDGACIFHRMDLGCTLSAEARPTACRLYPFEPGVGDAVTLGVERTGEAEPGESGVAVCLAVEEAHSLRDLARRFGTDLDSLRGLAGRLRVEVAEHGRPTADHPGSGRRRLR